MLFFEGIEGLSSRISTKISLHFSNDHTLSSSWGMVRSSMNISLAISGLNMGNSVENFCVREVGSFKNVNI